MKSLLLLLATALLASAFQAPAPAAAADPVVLTIGTEQITQSQFEAIMSTFNEQQRAALQAPEARRRLAEQLAELKVMAQEARKRNLHEVAATKMRIALQSDQILATATYADMTAADPAEADLRKYYDEHKAEWNEAKGRHILIRTPGSRVLVREGKTELTDEQALAKAKEVRAKIVGGADFGDVAKVESDDEGSGANGGELGSFSRGDMIPEFEDVAFSIAINEVSEPVKSDFGYHIIKIESRGAPPFEDVRERIVGEVKPELGQKAVDDLKAKTTVTLNDAYFGPPEIPAAPPQPAQ